MRYFVAMVVCSVCATAASGGLYPSLGFLSEPSQGSSSDTAQVNSVFDDLLKPISNWGALDPLTLPNITHGFETKAILKVKAEAGLYSGRVTGFRSIKRAADSRVKVGSDGVEMGADLSTGPVHIAYTGVVQAMSHTQNVTIDADVNTVQINVDAVLKPKAKPELKRIEVQPLKGARVQVQGLAALPAVSNALSVVFDKILEEKIRRAIEENLQKLFSEKLAELSSSIPSDLASRG
ncbi:uncharacterized protein LOC144167123 [Haemaphysalis longicornis]